MELPVPYKKGDGSYFIPWADLRAAGAWDDLSGVATSIATTEDAMRRIYENATKAREYLLGPPPPVQGE